MGSARALAGWSVAGLAGHLAWSVFNLERAAEVVPPPTARLLDIVDYYTGDQHQPAGSDVGRRIRELGDQEAAAGPGVLADRFTASIAGLEQRLARADLPHAVTLFGSPMSLAECATACLLELLVHADDLAVSVDLARPEFDHDADDLVASTSTKSDNKEQSGRRS